MRPRDKMKCPWPIRVASWVELVFGILFSVYACIGVFAVAGGKVFLKSWTAALWFLVLLSFFLMPVAARLTAEGRRAWRNVSGAFIVLRVALFQLGAIFESGALVIDEGFIAAQGVTLVSVWSAYALFGTQDARSYFAAPKEGDPHNPRIEADAAAPSEGEGRETE